jgi:glycosyltransferase involved in cell wall biosynthesis
MQSRVGWFVESQVAPIVNRGRQYVAVSERTKEELTWLGVGSERIRVIHNGTSPPLESGAGRSDEPTLLVLGRLVPHKRVEHAVDVVAALRSTHPTLRLRILGDGWWREHITEHARARGVADQVDLLGFVSESVKAYELDRAWLSLAPSVKEGWGLSVVEAASHGVPTVAYHDAGGLSESIIDGVTGMLVHSPEEMVGAARDLIVDGVRRASLSSSARELSRRYTWKACVDEWETLLGEVSRVSRRS